MRYACPTADTGDGVNLFPLLGRYFWVICLEIGAFDYLLGIWRLAFVAPDDPRRSREAIALRGWLAVFAGMPWLVMGWGIVYGGVPSIFYYFRPQDRNPIVLAWFACILLIALYFAYWVFLRGGAEKMMRAGPLEGFGNIASTSTRVKLYAALRPAWILLWMYIASLMDARVPK